MSDLRVALGGLPAAQRRNVQLAMITVDPRRDTPAVLTHYVHAFFPRGLALRTADPKLLAQVAKTFGAAYRVTTEKDGSVDVLHTPFVYAVDDTGRLRVQWSFGTPSRGLPEGHSPAARGIAAVSAVGLLGRHGPPATAQQHQRASHPSRSRSPDEFDQAVLGGGGDGPGAGSFVAGRGLSFGGVALEDVSGVAVGGMDTGGTGFLLDPGGRGCGARAASRTRWRRLRESGAVAGSGRADGHGSLKSTS